MNTNNYFANKKFWLRLTVVGIGIWLLISCIVSLFASPSSSVIFFVLGSLVISTVCLGIPWLAETCPLSDSNHMQTYPRKKYDYDLESKIGKNEREDGLDDV